MELKRCDRCKKASDEPNEIGVTVDIWGFTTTRGRIRPSGVLLEEARKQGMEYFPMEIKRDLFGEIDLCKPCFDDFMKLPQS